MKKKNNNKTNEVKFESIELKKSKYVNEDFEKVRSFIIIFFIVLILFGLLYFLNAKYITKDDFQNTKTSTTTTTEVSYDETVITVDKMFKIKDDKYMVVLFDKENDTDYMMLNSLILYYQGKTPLYTVDLNNKMNSAYINKDKNENKNPTKKEEVNVKGTRLLVFENGKVVSYLDDTEAIMKKLK